MTSKAELWGSIRKALCAARDQLPEKARSPSPGGVPVGLLHGTVAEFEEFLSHDEFELAWDALAEVAKRSDAGPLCWAHLAEAAGQMGLVAKQAEAAARARLRS